MQTGAVWLLAAAIASTLLAGCFRPPAPPSLSERQHLINGMVDAQTRILRDLPNPDPDSANEPHGIDLSGADITFTYWAPLFVISIDTHRRPFIAVLSALQFPPRSIRVTDRHTLPIATAWTDSDRCPALTKSLADLNILRWSPAPQRGSEYDGGGYLVHMSSVFAIRTFDVAPATLSGQDISPVGQWAAKTQDALSSCWTPLNHA
jgi:hypothetical protein